MTVPSPFVAGVARRIRPGPPLNRTVVPLLCNCIDPFAKASCPKNTIKRVVRASGKHLDVVEGVIRREEHDFPSDPIAKCGIAVCFAGDRVECFSSMEI